jgi:hypothetical protein
MAAMLAETDCQRKSMEFAQHVPPATTKIIARPRIAAVLSARIQYTVIGMPSAPAMTVRRPFGRLRPRLPAPRHYW